MKVVLIDDDPETRLIFRGLWKEPFTFKQDLVDVFLTTNAHDVVVLDLEFAKPNPDLPGLDSSSTYYSLSKEGKTACLWTGHEEADVRLLPGLKDAVIFEKSPEGDERLKEWLQEQKRELGF